MASTLVEFRRESGKGAHQMYLSIHTYRSLHLTDKPRCAAQQRALRANVPLPSTSTILHAHPPRRASVGFRSWSKHLQVTTLHSVAHTYSKLFTTAHPITSSVVPNLHPSPPIPNPNLDESSFFQTSPTSDQVALEYILPHPSLGLDDCQRIFELRLRKMV